MEVKEKNDRIENQIEEMLAKLVTRDGYCM